MHNIINNLHPLDANHYLFMKHEPTLTDRLDRSKGCGLSLSGHHIVLSLWQKRIFQYPNFKSSFYALFLLQVFKIHALF